MARRYHWISEGLTSYVNEPHAAVCCDSTSETLNLVAAESAGVRAASAALASQKPAATLLEMGRRHDVRLTDINPKYLHKVLLRTYEAAPRDFEQLLGIQAWAQKPCAPSPSPRSSSTARREPSRPCALCLRARRQGRHALPGRARDLRQDHRSDGQGAQRGARRPQRKDRRLPAAWEVRRMRVVSVNAGQPRTTRWRGRTVTSAIWKSPVAGIVRVGKLNLEGDRQADPSVHGGHEKAIYVYPSSIMRTGGCFLGNCRGARSARISPRKGCSRTRRT